MSDERDVRPEPPEDDVSAPDAGDAEQHEAPLEAAADAAREGRWGKLADAEEFSFTEAVGGWRGFVESVAPGFVFVLVFLTVGGMQVPVIAAVATMVILVVIRLAQRSSIQQALSGSIGVAIGAIWAWRTGEARDFYVFGLWINIVYGLGTLLSMAVRWPLVGIVMGLFQGDWKGWRTDPVRVRIYQRATAILVVMYALRLVVQVPLYLADQTAALGTARLAMGVPLFALTLWVVWLMVRNAGPRQAPEDQPQQTQ
ncbi:DUF3159 domain-containing protein [Demequina sediminicola]|uniref:DUF3159 domain-containing protein n=1 Tax=Demequina sediminicola TaxID=1095026 RepID=UPI000781585D|nr:DUF3159 domain-containing protein [Demequina sediminicola]